MKSGTNHFGWISVLNISPLRIVTFFIHALSCGLPMQRHSRPHIKAHIGGRLNDV